MYNVLDGTSITPPVFLAGSTFPTVDGDREFRIETKRHVSIVRAKAGAPSLFRSANRDEPDFLNVRLTNTTATKDWMRR